MQLRSSNVYERVFVFLQSFRTLDFIRKHGRTRDLKRIPKLFLPSFLQTGPNNQDIQVPKQSPASALQGLRGIAAVIVFHRHLLMSFSTFPDYGYGASESNRWIHQLPFLRLLYSGGAMIEIFFVLSGYTQSLKPLQQIEKRQWEKAQTTLASAICRRPFRLFLPTFTAASFIALAVWIGLYEWGSGFRSTWFDTPPQQLHREVTLLKQFNGMAQSFRGLLNVFNWELYYPDVNPHLWSIAVEFRASLLVQFILLGISKLRKLSQMMVLSAVILYCHFMGRWECVCFLIGVFIAKLNVMRGVDVQKCTQGSKPLTQITEKSRRCHSVHLVLFVLGLYLLGYPKKDGLTTPGYHIMAFYTPNTWVDHQFWAACGATCILFSITNCATLSHLFENSLFQYLGKIGYAVYLVHGPVLHITAHVFIPMMWSIFGRKSTVVTVVSFEVVASLIVVPVVVWTADLFWRLVDIPCGNLTFWLKEKAFIQDRHSTDLSYVGRPAQIRRERTDSAVQGNRG